MNGNEHFYFAGDTAALNAALKKFASIKADRLTVVLRPGPGKTNSFKKEQSLAFNWNLHLLGGIARHMSKRISAVTFGIQVHTYMSTSVTRSNSMRLRFPRA